MFVKYQLTGHLGDGCYYSLIENTVNIIFSLTQEKKNTTVQILFSDMLNDIKR